MEKLIKVGFYQKESDSCCNSHHMHKQLNHSLFSNLRVHMDLINNHLKVFLILREGVRNHKLISKMEFHQLELDSYCNSRHMHKQLSHNLVSNHQVHKVLEDIHPKEQFWNLFLQIMS